MEKHSYVLRKERPRQPCWSDANCCKLIGFKRKYLRLARFLCSLECWQQYKRTAGKTRRHIKTVSRKFWDSLSRDSSTSGNIFKILKGLAKRDTPRGENILRNPNPVDDEKTQSQMFLAAFRQDHVYEQLLYDLRNSDGSLDAPFTIDELNRAIMEVSVLKK